MNTVILLDAGPLGLATNPRADGQTFLCNAWIRGQIAQGNRVRIPEVADYEVRRELIRVGKKRGIAQLDEFKRDLGLVPITSGAWLLAAELWAQARQGGFPTAANHALDADVLIAAQALLIQRAGHPVIVATTNTKHLTHFVDARHWHDIA